MVLDLLFLTSFTVVFIFGMSGCRARAITNAQWLFWVQPKPILAFQSPLRSTESSVLGRAVGQTFLHLVLAALIVKHHLQLSSQH